MAAKANTARTLGEIRIAPAAARVLKEQKELQGANASTILDRALKELLGYTKLTPGLRIIRTAKFIKLYRMPRVHPGDFHDALWIVREFQLTPQGAGIMKFLAGKFMNEECLINTALILYGEIDLSNGVGTAGIEPVLALTILSRRKARNSQRIRQSAPGSKPQTSH